MFEVKSTFEQESDVVRINDRNIIQTPDVKSQIKSCVNGNRSLISLLIKGQ